MTKTDGERESENTVLAARHNIYIYIYIYIYAPPWGLSTLAKELSTAASVMHSGNR